MKKQIMTITAIAMGATAFTNLSATANAGVMSPGLINTAEFTSGNVEITKVGGGHRRGFRSHRGHRGHRFHRGHRGHRWGHGRWGHGRWGHGYRKYKWRHNFGHYGYNSAWKRYKRCLRLQAKGYRIRCYRPL